MSETLKQNTKTQTKQKRRIKGEGCVTQLSNGKYTARVNLGIKEDGKPIIKAFYGKNSKEVVKKMDEFKHDMKLKEYTEKNEPHFDEYITKWLRNVKFNEIKSTSFDRLESTIKNHINPVLGHLTLSQVNDSIIQENLINGKMKNKSYSSIKKIYDALNACFKYAIARRDIQYNPMNVVTLPSQTKFTKSKDIDIFTDDEVIRLIEVAQSTYSNGVLKYRNGWGIILMIYTGLRIGEALALKWEDYDSNEKTLTVHMNLALIKNRDNDENDEPNYILVAQDTVKTKTSERVIPLSKMAITALNNLKLTSSNYIISNKYGKAIRARNFQNTFDSMLTDAGLKHVGHHVTRHTFASMLFDKGAEVKVVSELLGHSDIRITYNTYIHLIKKQKTNVVNLLD